MLGKLLKYDLKWIYKVVGVFYILAFIFSIIGRLLSYIENSVVFSIISQFSYGLACGMILSSFINSVMRLWTRFIKSAYKDESYLTHTLPVEKKMIYASKAISALITIFTTAIVGIACLFICFYSDSNIEYIKTILELAASTYRTTVVNILLLVSTVITLQILLWVVIGYLGIILGYKSNQSKMLKTIVYSFAIYMATQMISLILIYIFGLFNSNVMNLINTTEMISVNMIKIIMCCAIGLYLVYISALYFLGKKAFEKGVNVE